jgi:hypothetical protein
MGVVVQVNPLVRTCSEVVGGVNLRLAKTAFRQNVYWRANSTPYFHV